MQWSTRATNFCYQHFRTEKCDIRYIRYVINWTRPNHLFGNNGYQRAQLLFAIWLLWLWLQKHVEVPWRILTNTLVILINGDKFKITAFLNEIFHFTLKRCYVNKSLYYIKNSCDFQCFYLFMLLFIFLSCLSDWCPRWFMIFPGWPYLIHMFYPINFQIEGFILLYKNNYAFLICNILYVDFRKFSVNKIHL